MSIVGHVRNWAMAAALALMASSPMAGTPEGRITYTSGGAYVERGAQKIPLRDDMLVEVGDILVTESDGRVQWRMADDSYFAIRPNSRFKIEEFNKPGTAGGGKAFYSLLKGGYRCISGLIGKTNPADYRVISPVATMGIRGTDHTHVICQGDCAWAPGGKVTDGLYSRVDLGASVLSNAEGTLDVKAGQYARTASPPALLAAMPSVFANWEVDFHIELDAPSVQGKCSDNVGGVNRAGSTPRAGSEARAGSTHEGDCVLRIEGPELPGIIPSPN